MKQILFIFIFILPFFVASFSFAEEVVKTCSFVVQMPSEARTVPSTYKIIQKGPNLIAQLSQVIDGKLQTGLDDEPVTRNETSIRENLSSSSTNLILPNN
jgi:hypothetical protein